MKETLQIIAALIGSLGFAVLFNIRGKKLVYIAMGGALSWVIYLIAFHLLQSIIISVLISSISIALLSEILARYLKTPVIILLVPMIIPLIPGKDLYYTMYYLVCENSQEFVYYSELVVKEALAIVLGIVLVYSIAQIITKILVYTKKHSIFIAK